MEFETELQTDHIQISIEGIYNKDVFLQAINTALELAIANQLAGVLIDLRKINGLAPGTMERYELGCAIAELQRNKTSSATLAIVGLEHFIDRQRFSETVALNRGAIGKVFTDYDAAAARLNLLLPSVYT